MPLSKFKMFQRTQGNEKTGNKSQKIGRHAQSRHFHANGFARQDGAVIIVRGFIPCNPALARGVPAFLALAGALTIHLGAIWSRFLCHSIMHSQIGS